MDKKLAQTSKFLSYVLRHKPEDIGITLDKQGWVDVGVLLIGCTKHGYDISFEELKLVVDSNDKQRFAFNEDKTKIRASQGHSIEIDLGYEEVRPPSRLYHGTAIKNLMSISTKGILKGDRHHVHLSDNPDIAREVGRRYGSPSVITVYAKAMHDDGFKFFKSENGVWLTEHVPVRYLLITR